ncbi:MAG: hypothetical protein WCL29_05565, partial [Pseudomonadota bacterium]
MRHVRVVSKLLIALFMPGLVSMAMAENVPAKDELTNSDAVWGTASPELLDRVITKRRSAPGTLAASPTVLDESAFIATHPPLTIPRGKTGKAGRQLNPPLLLRAQNGALRSISFDGSQLVFTTQPDPGARYRLVAATDLDGNGTTDLAYQNLTQGESGEVRWWSSYSPSTDTAIRSVKVAWDVQVVGDLDGDGLGDMVWRYMLPGSNDTGVSYVWFRNADGTVQVRKR